MNAYQIAMKMEKEAEKAYRDMANQTADETMKKVLVTLANEEAKHYSVFKKMSKQESALKEIEGFCDIPLAKDIFSEIKLQKKHYSFNEEQVAFYTEAANLEDKTYGFYLEQAAIATDPEVKKAFTIIANEEKKHNEIVGNLAEFVAEPDTWLESAEFYKITEEV